MAIIKNEIPILEFDTEQTAVLNPTHENLGLNLPKKCVFAFLGAYIDEYASKSDTKQVSTFESATKHYPIYITKYKGEDRRRASGSGLSEPCGTAVPFRYDPCSAFLL